MPALPAPVNMGVTMHIMKICPTFLNNMCIYDSQTISQDAVFHDICLSELDPA